MATKIFQIHFPVKCKKPTTDKKCGSDVTDKPYAPEIVCRTTEKCEADQRWCCTREYTGKGKRKPPPFPAFSDCLDEEMEDILTECPLDKEKYLRMQPRFMNPPPKPCCLIKPPPPIQGKIDLLKEEECIREKLCLENKGLTQVCDEFGKPVELMKNKKYFPEEENKDCKRMEELKKLGRWPPRTLKSTRHFSTNAWSFRRFSTLGFNSKDDEERHKKVYSKNYHALLKTNDKTMFSCSQDNTINNIKKTKEQWRVQNMKINEHLNRNNTIALKTPLKYFGRNFSTGRPLLYKKLQYYRGKRQYNNIRKPRGGSNAKEKCKIKTHKKTCPKFTLNSCPYKERSHCVRVPYGKDCSKPFTPYPAYSECKEHEIVDNSCDCSYDVKRMPDLQPRYPILNNESVVKEFPTQEKINRSLGIEYYRCKHGIVNEGQTIGCNCLEDECRSNAVEFLVQDHKKSEETEKEPDHCEMDRKKLQELCMSECLKTIPCDLPEEEKYCICKEQCQKFFNKEELNENCAELKANKIDCETQQQQKKLKNVECIKAPPKTACKDIVVKPQCKTKKTSSFTHLESIWQKVVNYFKARPNCPQPGDYKKKALKEKAEKAATAAGLVVIDPKCISSELLKCVKPKKDCKVCPNQKQSTGNSSRSCSPESNKRHFSFYQPTRNYSKSISCKNLEEINKMLEEAEMKQQEISYRSNTKSDFILNQHEKSDIDELKMSIDVALNKPVDLFNLCNKDGKYPRTYFGYSNIIPSRENILERAWRVSIEAYNRCNYPKNYSFYDFFTRVEQAIKKSEDMEKIKTEDVLRELDELLQNGDPNSSKNKK